MSNFKYIFLVALAIASVIGVMNRGQLFSWREGVPANAVTLHADENGHFFGHLTINGESLKYIVDSGASNVTLNSVDASRVHIDYAKGEVISLVTPNGEIQAFSLKLNGLVIGPATLNNVEVTVIDGNSPPYVLLGISAQRKLDVKRDNAVMTLGLKP